MSEPFRPALLLSMPQLQDPNFAQTVVLLCDYTPDGAFGLVLNRPTEMPATRDGAARSAGRRAATTCRCGSAVRSSRSAAGCCSDTSPPTEFKTIRDGLYLSTSPVAAARRCSRRAGAARARPRRLRRLGPGQLDEELAQSAWLMGDVDLDLVFDVEAASMWETAIRRLGADPSMLTTSHGVH